MRGFELRFLLSLFLLVEGGLALGAAWICHHHHRVYRQAFLRLWSWSFGALFVALALEVVRFQIPRGTLLTTLVRLPLGAGWQAAVWLHAAFLVLGAWSLRQQGKSVSGATPSPLAMRVGRIALVLGGLFGVLRELLPAAPGRAMIGGALLSSFVTLTGYIAAGILVALRQRERPARLGERLVIASLLAVGFWRLASQVVMLGQFFNPALLSLFHWTSAVDLVAILVLAVGVLLWLQGEERERAETAMRELLYVSRHDSLTRLPNRQEFVDRLRQLLPATGGADAARTSVVVLGLGRAQRQQVEEVGGEVGLSARLAAVAELVRRSYGAETLIGRLDRHRLAVAAPLGADALPRLQQLLEEAAREPAQGGVGMILHAGVGAVSEEDREGEALLDQASAAQWLSEEGGRGVERFAAAAGDGDERLQGIAAELRLALATHQLELHYQPILDLRTGRFSYVEALLRWRHPTRGLLPPGSFLGAVATAGLAAEVDRHVLDLACRGLAEQRERGETPLPVAVNLDAGTVHRPELVEWVQDSLALHRVDASLLEIEITEAAAMRDVDGAIAVLGRLRALGVAVGLDDFGVGHSSMLWLKQLPVDKLKIDRGFLANVHSDPREAAIVRVIVDLGHRLGLRVVVEGVESERQLAFARESDADLVQGYLLSRPQPRLPAMAA